MKKLATIVSMACVSVFFGVAVIHAAQQRNWSTTNGGVWNTPNDSTVGINQFLVIGDTNTAGPTVSAVSQPALQSQTLAQIQASTASYVGQIAFCSNCVNSAIVVATGTTAGSQWVSAFSTGTAFSAAK